MAYQAKHAKHTKQQHIKKSAFLLIALMLVISVGTGSTVAYIIDKPNALTNVFLPAKVACAVTESYQVKNTGDVEVYMRAAVVMTWKAEDNSGNVYGQKPACTLNGIGAKWTLGSDGYYYYTEPIKAGESTNALFTGYTVSDTAPTGYALSIEIVAEAIQADPFANAEAAWNTILQ